MALALAAAVSGALAEPLFLAVDVPTTVAGTTYAPHQILRFDAGAYTVVATFPQELSVLALDRADDDRWLVVPAFPVTVGGTEYTPRDVVITDGSSFARAFDGAAAGIPAGVRIDALLPGDHDSWVFSFDVPVTLNDRDFGRSDLVRYDGAFSLVWDAQSAAVPAYANVNGVGRSGAGYVVSFDVPTRLGGIDVLPGQIVRVGAESAALFSGDAAWPPGSQLRDFAVAVPRTAGAVPDGNETPGVPLTLAKGPAATLTLQWGAACGDGASDYEVYAGTLGAWTASAPAACSTTGGQSWSASLPAGNVFYLVVPRSDSFEGSYGQSSNGQPRPPSPAACLPQEPGTCNGPA